MLCHYCKAENSENARFCNQCGAQLDGSSVPVDFSTPTAKAKYSGAAALALILGIASPCAAFDSFSPIALFALIVGIIAVRRILKSHGRLSGAFSAISGIVLGFMSLVLGTTTEPSNFTQAATRSKVARVRADMRTISQTLEKYKTDHKTYPAWTNDPLHNGFANLSNHKDFKELPTFQSRQLVPWSDPFAPAKNAPFCYYVLPTSPTQWIVWSAGPDRKYDLTMINIEKLLLPGRPFSELINVAYDPTNGSTSRGDVYRVKN